VGIRRVSENFILWVIRKCFPLITLHKEILDHAQYPTSFTLPVFAGFWAEIFLEMPQLIQSMRPVMSSQKRVLELFQEMAGLQLCRLLWKQKRIILNLSFTPLPKKSITVFFVRPCIVYNRLTLLSSIESENKKIGMDWLSTIIQGMIHYFGILKHDKGALIIYEDLAKKSTKDKNCFSSYINI
jgi:hypothetical protein